MKIGDEVYIHGYIDEIRKDTIIIKNDGGYFGTIPSEIIDREPKTDGDCISRDMALEKMADYVSSGYADSAEDFEAYSKIICELPSVNPQEQKTEHWIYTGDYITDGMLKCSECGFEHDVSERFLYCPNCGAKMESEG